MILPSEYINIHAHKFDDNSDIILINLMHNDELFSSKTNQVFYSYGIHPWFLKDYSLEIKKLDHYLSNNQIVAIGECGLDPNSDYPVKLQTDVFRMQVELSEKYRKPLIIHCVKAFNEIIKIRKDGKSQMPWILHGFNANEEITKECIRHGLLFSFGHHLLQSNSNAVRNVKTVPLNSLFFETDQSNESIKDIYEKYASLTDSNIDLVKKVVVTNFKSIFY